MAPVAVQLTCKCLDMLGMIAFVLAGRKLVQPYLLFGRGAVELFQSNHKATHPKSEALQGGNLEKDFGGCGDLKNKVYHKRQAVVPTYGSFG